MPNQLTKIPKFRRCVLQNFPFIEQDFDALTDYALLCKVVEYLNNVITNENALTESQTNLIAQFNTLKDYVDNYFDNLDVQEEINSKLDEMAEDGTLTTLIGAYCQPLIEAQNEEIANFKSTVNGQIIAQDAKIDGILESNPIFVSSTDSMTDNTKIYVLTSNNHIYQYSAISDTIVDTGAIYSSQGTTVPIYGTVIQAGNYETRLPDLDSATSSNIYCLLFARGAENKPAHLPTPPTGDQATLVVVVNGANITQTYITRDSIYIREKYSTQAWTQWFKNDTLIRHTISTSNYATYCPDLNDINETCGYVFAFPAGSTTVPAHYPIVPDGSIETLYTYKFASNTCQVMFSRKNVYYRFKAANTWLNWYPIVKFEVKPSMIMASNYATLLPDLDNVTENSVYNLLFATGAVNKPAHLPIAPSDKIETLETYVVDGGSYEAQIYTCKSGTFYRYKAGGSWVAWSNANPNNVYIVGSGEAYTTLKEAVETAVQSQDSVVIVKQGTYNLYEEFGGDDFFSTYDASTTKGLVLRNGVKIIFASHSKVTFNNSNNYEQVSAQFSPFNTGSGGCTVENLTLDCTNCRYGIHDERGGSTDTYINKFINCNIKQSGGYQRCIGGGLGKSGEIVIENCVFNCVGRADNADSVSYHNNNSATDSASRSNLVVKNNFFVTGTFRLSWCGVSTLITDCICTGNKLKSNPIHKAEREQDVIENTNLMAWNNTIA